MAELRVAPAPVVFNFSVVPRLRVGLRSWGRFSAAHIVCLAKKRVSDHAPAPKVAEPAPVSEDLLEEDVVLEGLNELANDALQVMLGKKSKSVMDCLEELDEAGEYLVKEGKLDAARFVLVIKNMLDHQVIAEKNDLEGAYKRAFERIWSCVEDSGWSLAMPENETGVDLLDDELIPPVLNQR
ncbi:uncharacterized protein LOC112345450 [Selaginella moellendorffii]|uniref:uncharacterized protein LOC112345450 n=1 Tax=Selaginella moellendorffii TaxID=88036 RepID=UPI000D1C36D4|nr:uncharacterized protein LOC112345450 [Selaginella moellendorffii]|eukprot:XP_024527988.1 uncharacterized protein LOC112345450 [Selaginella moellendorffii]